MLPGFRFLFAAVMLSLSLLVFGVGAASLMRAAHQTFAGNPSWRSGPDVTLAPRADATPAMLASLRVETPAMETVPVKVTAAPQATWPVEAVVPDTESAPAKITTFRPEDALPLETAKVEDGKLPDSKADGTETDRAAIVAPPADSQPIAAAASVTVAAAGPDEIPTGATSIATFAIPQADPSTSAPDVAQPEPASEATPNTESTDAAPSPAMDHAAVKIATLGGPPVDIFPEKPVKQKAANQKADQEAARKRLKARRAAHRRRLARARLLAQQQLLLQQQQADPFLQPFPQPTPAATPKPALTSTAAKRRPPPKGNQAGPVATGGPPA